MNDGAFLSSVPKMGEGYQCPENVHSVRPCSTETVARMHAGSDLMQFRYRTYRSGRVLAYGKCSGFRSFYLQFQDLRSHLPRHRH